ncbi:hypothetical protein [Neobacillus sp. PS2-9]|uniref:hypothetical protein n=1 Tax=Neobacillus sp. PS2-9 TaxID=3070676 RepID=UPI0027DF3A7C|nr:hypothetical protein [Neobacillus sp. PS2-9]WML58689.1 hypothetical protein RCG25_02530 [Neobacillus sp. PS2-9]
MSKILTTGPMLVPRKITGDPVGGPPDEVAITIKNPTSKDFRVQIFADICPPDSTTERTESSDLFTIPKDGCLRLRLFNSVLPDSIIRLYAKGGVDEEAEKLELSFVGRRASDRMHEPTMFFRHADLIEVENGDLHHEPRATLTSNWVIG